MNIFEFAMKMEKDGEDYYRDLAGKTTNEGLKYILTMLADAEVKHYDILKKMSKAETNPGYVETDVLKSAKNVFVEMKEKKDSFELGDSQVDFYKKAYDIEEKSYKFYLEKSDEVPTVEQKKLLLQIAEEEKKHMHLMDNLAEFVSRPETWVENAEFNKLEEY